MYILTWSKWSNFVVHDHTFIGLGSRVMTLKVLLLRRLPHKNKHHWRVLTKAHRFPKPSIDTLENVHANTLIAPYIYIHSYDNHVLCIIINIKQRDRERERRIFSCFHFFFKSLFINISPPFLLYMCIIIQTRSICS